MRTNEKIATTKNTEDNGNTENKKIATTEAQKTTEARNIKTLEVGISLDPWSVVNRPRL